MEHWVQVGMAMAACRFPLPAPAPSHPGTWEGGAREVGQSAGTGRKKPTHRHHCFELSPTSHAAAPCRPQLEQDRSGFGAPLCLAAWGQHQGRVPPSSTFSLPGAPGWQTLGSQLHRTPIRPRPARQCATPPL